MTNQLAMTKKTHPLNPPPQGRGILDFACATAPTRAYALNSYFVAAGLCHEFTS
ncbi:hypothetical protein [Helicobacter sp. T3_23-1056]